MRLVVTVVVALALVASGHDVAGAALPGFDARGIVRRPMVVDAHRYVMLRPSSSRVRVVDTARGRAWSRRLGDGCVAEHFRFPEVYEQCGVDPESGWRHVAHALDVRTGRRTRLPQIPAVECAGEWYYVGFGRLWVAGVRDILSREGCLEYVFVHRLTGEVRTGPRDRDLDSPDLKPPPRGCPRLDGLRTVTLTRCDATRRPLASCGRYECGPRDVTRRWAAWHEPRYVVRRGRSASVGRLVLFDLRRGIRRSWTVRGGVAELGLTRRRLYVTAARGRLESRLLVRRLPR